MKKTAVFTDKTCALHDTGAGHPEQIARLASVIKALKDPAFAHLEWHDASRDATVEQLERVHDAAYVADMLAAAPAEGYVKLDEDTVICPDSINAALRAAGAVVAAVDHVMGGKADAAFCAIRPPGHHAEKGKPMGFCIFANAAIGAFHAVKEHGLERVAIIDFDVHHGNGTANIVDGHKEFLFVSTHQSPFWPFTGDASEKGALDNIINVPLAAGDGAEEFRTAFTDIILPALDAFKPELIIISAGFDAHQDDPLAEMNLTEDDYVWVTEELQKIAEKHAQGRIVSAMEGGYNLKALASCVAAHVDTLSKDASPALAPKTPQNPTP